MFYGHNPHDTRQLFFTSWQKQQNNQILTPLEAQIVAVIREHPEYHALFAAAQPNIDNFGHNPFLHMGLHLAIRDQCALNRPIGIREIYDTLLRKIPDQLQVEHLLMECLEACLWQAQQAQRTLQQVPQHL